MDIVSGDFNHDDTLDVAVANFGVVGADPGNARILTNNGSGTFSLGETIATQLDPVSIAASNLNGDEFVDLVTADQESDAVTVALRAPGGGGYLPPRHYPVSHKPRRVVPGGLDNPKDLDNDIAVVTMGAVPGSGTVDVLRNVGPGAGTFAPSVPLVVGNNPSSAAIVDMDNDHDNDIAVVVDGTEANAGSSVIRVVRNDTANAGNGQLTFALQPGELNANSPAIVLSGDVNNDGRPDLIAVNSGTSALRPAGEAEPGRTEPVRIAVLRNVLPCPDVNDDSLVDTSDLLLLLGSFGQPAAPGNPVDINRDGVVNTSDLLLLLGAFGRNDCPQR